MGPVASPTRPTPVFYGTELFTYMASDGYGFFQHRHSQHYRQPRHPTPPVATNDSYSVNEDTTLTLPLTAGTTSLVMQSQTGDYIGQGRNYGLQFSQRHLFYQPQF